MCHTVGTLLTGLEKKRGVANSCAWLCGSIHPPVRSMNSSESYPSSLEFSRAKAARAKGPDRGRSGRSWMTALCVFGLGEQSGRPVYLTIPLRCLDTLDMHGNQAAIARPLHAHA